MSSERRGIYFSFQGLLMAVLMLLFVLYHQGESGWTMRFAVILLLSSASLVGIQLAPAKAFESASLPTALFIGDALAAFLILSWTGGNPLLFLLFFVVLLGTALTRQLRPTVAVAAICSLLYFVAEWRHEGGLPDATEFWLRLHFLWIATILLAILARDNRRAQREEEARYQGRLTQLESLATLGQVAGEVAHRIKGPLTTIRVNTEIVSQRLQGSDRKDLEQALTEVEHIKTILKGLLDMGRIEEADFEPVDLREPLRKALASVEAAAKEKGVRISSAVPDRALSARADRSLLHEAFSAVLQNAVDASPPGGLVAVTAGPRAAQGWFARAGGAPAFWEIVVRDAGAGIRREDLERIFRPFFTTKGSAGTGLGLSAALRILQLHSGSIQADSDGPGQGAEFRITLPALDA